MQVRWPAPLLAASTRLDHLLENESALAKPTGRIRAQTLTVNGLVNPIGVDPDGVTFAWTVHAAGRSIVQSAYRVILRRTDPGHGATVWDSGPVLSAQQAFLAYPGPTLVSDAAYEWTVRPRGYAEQWGPPSAAARFTTGLRGGDWQGQWLRPAGDSSQPDRVTYVRTEVTPPGGTLTRGLSTCRPRIPTDSS